MIEWAVRYEDPMTVYMDGSHRINTFVMISKEQAEAAVDVLSGRAGVEDAKVMFREVGEWQQA